MLKDLGPGLRLTVAFTILTGFIYPFLMTGLSQAIFPRQADGSLVRVHGTVVGSSLIGQSFAKPQYFHPRPSDAGSGYDATQSGGSNLGPTNAKLINGIKASIAEFRKENPTFKGPIPSDIVTASASGLDPDISPAAAEDQAARVAAARGISVRQIQQSIAQFTQGPTWGFLGDSRVNVLMLNLALDRDFPVAGRQSASSPAGRSAGTAR
jgi:potassium-transporting ATPase KdpC subunit